MSSRPRILRQMVFSAIPLKTAGGDAEQGLSVEPGEQWPFSPLDSAAACSSVAKADLESSIDKPPSQF
jgi:hypothetical protein